MLEAILRKLRPGRGFYTLLVALASLVSGLMAGCSVETSGQNFPPDPAQVAPSFAEIAAKNANKRKVVICHRTGNGKRITIEVDEHAIPAHLAHGDTLGSCNETPPPPPGPDNIPVPSSAVAFVDGIAFLFQGSNPTQTGVEPGTIEAHRATVIRGAILGRDGGPLSGVKVSILHEPRLGQTLSRSDGMFDLAVNGGGQLTLKYEKTGFLSAQRTVQVPWNDYVFAADVVLIAKDAQVTTIDPQATVPMRVARSSPVTDEDGSRQPTLLFPQGTDATMVFAGGGRASLDVMNVHVTEYTVGANGPETMPAQLPPTSAYTYCVEFSVDEADAQGAVSVEFSQPLIHYVENFLEMPTGLKVPVGFYDRELGCWIPEKDGRVIRILAVEGGRAVLDVDGTGQPADGAKLSELAITDAEREQIARLYTPGQSLWRLQVPHFSPCDPNLPVVCEEECDEPQLDEVEEEEEKSDCDSLESGSTIEVANQILRETLGIVGTPFTLNYASDRVPGRTSADAVRIPLCGATVPAGLKRIEVEIQVAGQRFQETFPPQANLVHRFSWNGKDAFGRTVQGRVPMTVKTSYAFPGVYAVPANLAESFGLPSGIPGTVPARRDVVLSQRRRIMVGNWDARGVGMGGWTLSAHHAYDPTSQTLYLGDGSRRSAESTGATINTIAGNGAFAFAGDGGPAVDATLGAPVGVAVAPDGSIYIADTHHHRIRRIRSGVITTVAGNGSFGFNGDGPALSTNVSYPQGIVVDQDGSVYFAETETFRVRRLTPDGMIVTVAGNGTRIYRGDGVAATSTGIESPVDVALGPDCALYFITWRSPAAYRVAPDGIISTVAGDRTAGFAGDGGPATNAKLGRFPYAVAVTPEGELLIADTLNNRIRKVGIDGIITTVAGNGTAGTGTAGEGGPAVEAPLDVPQDVFPDFRGGFYVFDERGSGTTVRQVRSDGTIVRIAGEEHAPALGDGGLAINASIDDSAVGCLSPDGSLLISDQNNNRIRRVSSPYPSFTFDIIAIPSADGSLLYKFDSGGRHLQTLNTLTGVVLYSFEYDANGRLSKVTDGDGNVTTIERNADGPTAIVGPFGQRTALTVDGNRFLASVANPAGETVQLGYTPDGLLTSLVDPKENPPYMFSYDALGRLVKDQDPAGGFKELARTELEDGLEVSVTTAEGRVSRYRSEHLPTGEHRHTEISQDGTTAIGVIHPDGTETSTFADGTVSSASFGPDPRFGMQAPFPKTRTVTSGGLTWTESAQRTLTLADPSNPLSLLTLSDTFVRNGDNSTSVYDAAARRMTLTTPEGRSVQMTFRPQGQITSLVASGLAPIFLTYDTNGKLQRIATAEGGGQTLVKTFGYNARGLLETVTDATGRSFSYGYDAAGRRTQKTLQDGKIISWAYDGNGNITSLEPPGRPSHNFEYNPVNIAVRYSPPSAVPGGETRYFYNLDGQHVSTLRADGRSPTASYDAAGRMSVTTFSRGEVRYGYDSGNGLLSSILAPDGGMLAFAYQGSLPRLLTWTGSVQGTVAYTYDDHFRATSESVNGQAIASLTYDRDHFLTRAGDMVLTRDPQTPLITSTGLHGVSDAFQYDTHGELAEHVARVTGSELFRVAVTRDPLGRINHKIETIEGQTATYDYDYDATGQLEFVRRDGQLVSTYRYDDNGNRLEHISPETTLSGSYDDQDRLLRYGTTNYTYNANGDLSTKSQDGRTTAYSYDEMGNLVAAALPDGRVLEYILDGANRRVGKNVDGNRVKGFLYGDALRPMVELDADNNVVSTFVYGEGSNVPEYLVRSGSRFRLIKDDLGSPRLIVNASTGEVVQRLDYDEFGRVMLDTNPGFQPFGFAGGLYDADTGLVRFGERDYDADAGRWTTRDPILFRSGGVNLYSYVENDPINFADPDGRVIHIQTVAALLIVAIVAPTVIPVDLNVPPETPPPGAKALAGLGVPCPPLKTGRRGPGPAPPGSEPPPPPRKTDGVPPGPWDPTKREGEPPPNTEPEPGPPVDGRSPGGPRPPTPPRPPRLPRPPQMPPRPGR